MSKTDKKQWQESSFEEMVDIMKKDPYIQALASARAPAMKHKLVRIKVRDQVWDQVGDQVWDQVWDQVRDQVWDQVGWKVMGQVWDEMGRV